MNGYDPVSLPLWARNILSKRFNNACISHDNWYKSGDGNRMRADVHFLRDMLLKCEGDYNVLVALTYYFLIRVFGWLYWSN